MLYEAVLTLKDVDGARHFQDLCTVGELRAMDNGWRWPAAGQG